MKIFKEIYLAINIWRNIFPEIASLHILIFATFFQQIIFACSRKKKLIFKGNIFAFNPNIFNKKYFYSTHENTILNNWLSKIVFKILLSFTNMQLSAKWFKIIVLRLQILFRKSWSDANTRRRVGGKGGIMSLASLCCKNLKCV